MVTQTEWAKIQKLLGVGLSVPELSRRIGRSTTTLYRLMKIGGPRVSSKKIKRYKEVLRYEKYLNSRIKNGVTNVSKLFQELKSQDFQGSYALLYQYLKSNPIDFRGYKQSKHVETGPGEQAQVDWGYFGKIEVHDKIERLYCFVYVLCYSRMKYIEFTIRQNLQTLEQCHIKAFEKLGIPKTIVYDNMKTVVTNRRRFPDGTSAPLLNAAFLDFAKYYSFQIEPTGPYHPRSKGKVEAVVKFVRNNFMQGMRFKKDFKSLEELNEKAKYWLDNVANRKPHNTTEERPVDRWNKEKPFLNFPDNLPTYEISIFQPRFVTKDGSLDYKSSVYPVPFEYARKQVFVKEDSENGLAVIEIYDDYKMIAKYYLSAERNKWIKENDAIFFKRHPQQKPGRIKRGRLKKKSLKNKYPTVSIPARPSTYYNQLIPGGRIK